MGRQPHFAAQSDQCLASACRRRRHRRVHSGPAGDTRRARGSLRHLDVAWRHDRLSDQPLADIGSRSSNPCSAAIYAIPIILFLPLYVLLLGLGPASKIALGATISFFPIVLSTIVGFGYVDRTAVVTAARSMGANNLQMFRHVLLPAALPVILAGLRMGFTVALLSVIGSETIASLAGLGHRIVDLAENMDMARMFAYIVFVMAIVAFLNAVVSKLKDEARWR